MDYQSLTDEELVEKAKSGDTVAMETVIDRYKNTVKILSRRYFLTGGDSDDLLQEGMLGVFRATMTYNGKSPFKSFAYRCINAHLINVVRKFTRDKNKPLMNFVSISGDGENDVDKSLLAVGIDGDPLTTVINAETESELKNVITNKLSDFENGILTLFLQGYSYSEIAERINKSEKSVDNAIQRIRKKLR